MTDIKDSTNGQDQPVVIIHIPNTEPALRKDLSVLKHEKSFAILCATGDVQPLDSNDVSGLFVKDMRHISTLEATFGREMALIKPGRSSDDKIEFTANLADADGRLKVANSVILKDDILYRVIEMRNDSTAAMNIPLHLSTGSDCIAMFALRFPKDCRSIYERLHPERRSGPLGVQGPITQPFNRAAALTFEYTGLDHQVVDHKTGQTRNGVRKSFISCSEKPININGSGLDFDIVLSPGGRRCLYIEAGAGDLPGVDASAQRYNDTMASLRKARQALLDGGAKVTIGDPAAQKLLDESMTDIALLSHHEKTGLYLDAGLPWYVTNFGRDALTSSNNLLWRSPDYLAGALRYLASTQATVDNSDTAAERGKIQHEERLDELMFAINPKTGKPYRNFERIYAGDDQTLLFITSAYDYLRRTGDVQLIEDIMPQLELATEWMMKRFTPDGFFGYGWNKDLSNQRMYDSEFSMFYKNGDHRVVYPRKPLEVQGYAYAALLAYQKLAKITGRATDQELEPYAERAEQLKNDVNEKFWMPERDQNGTVHDPDKGSYAHAMDGNGVLCPETTTTSGDILRTGIVPPKRAKAIAETLLQPRFFNGGGIRTVPNDSIRYCSFGYHIGSVWPHITSETAWGFKQYGLNTEATALIEGNQKIGAEMGGSLPELIEGDTDLPHAGFRRFQQACHPQAFSASAVVRDIQTAQLADIDAIKSELRLDPSAMPIKWGSMRVENLAIGGGRISYEMEPQGAIRILESEGAPIRVIDARTGVDVPHPPKPAPVQTLQPAPV